ncbi:hypothetical protein E4T56_gene2831 [Termitomyces sp. T112]|nr:hypothetical protein E4T56_gene2831 [Termitomyces sp. T112]
MWTEQSRRCPLCFQSLGDHLLHNIRSKHDFSKHHLPPLRSSPVPERNIEFRQRPRTARERERDRRLWEEREASDRLTQSIEKRRWIYHHNLYAKHVASNAYTRYRPYPTPAQFAASKDLIKRTTIFLRRELQVWDNIDVEFLTTFAISLMKSIDIRSESAVKLLAEFLDLDVPYVEGGRYVNAEHFAHEVYSFVRSPYRDLFVYDSVVQYDTVNEEPPQAQPSRRWRSVHHSRSRSRPPSRNDGTSRDRSVSYSPSGRRYSYSTNDIQPTPGSSINRRINRSGRNQPDRKGSEQIAKAEHARTYSSDGCDTSRRLEKSVKGKTREQSAHETVNTHVDLAEGTHSEVRSPATVTGPVAQSSAQSYIPAGCSRPPLIRPGYRFLVQAVQTHLKRGSDSQLGGSGTKPKYHHEVLLSDHPDP